MKHTMTVLGSLMVAAAPVMASTGQEVLGLNILTILFLGFGSFIVMCQLIPAFILAGSALKTLIGKTEKKVSGKIL